MSRLRIVKHRLNRYRLRVLAARPVTAGDPIFAVHSEGASDAVGLSFDDGPSPHHTPQVLELLSEYGARATFFVVGQRVEAHPELVDAAGRLHEIGNHSHTHPRPSQLTDEELRAELEAADRAIKAAGQTATLARPPWGEHRQRFSEVAGDLGLNTVMWSVDSGDTATQNGRAIGASAGRARGGDILLFHDGGASPESRLEGLDLTLAALKRRGLHVVSVSDLLGRG
jgi:peptidoglycan/xylan/chitin deacetylase (PgdA/CDA1 family)